MPDTRTPYDGRDHKVVFAFVRDPRVSRGGAELRIAAILERLRAERRVDGLELGAGIDVECAPRLTDRILAMARGVPPRLSQRLDHAVAGKVERELGPTDRVIIGTTFTAPLIPRSAWDRSILDAHNLEWRVVNQMRETATVPVRRAAYTLTSGWTRSYERSLARSVAGVWAVSEDEAEWFADAGARRVWVIPNGVTIPPEPGPPPEDTPRLVFVASFKSAFNADGLRWFLDEMWDTIRAAVPRVELHVAGSGAESMTGPGVVTHGFVEDLEPLYMTAAAAIVPLRFGAGTRLKVLEAIARARPVVSTTLGVDGLGLRDGDGVRLADDPGAFADRVVELLTSFDDARRLGGEGRRIATERFDWQRIGAAAGRTLEELSW